MITDTWKRLDLELFVIFIDMLKFYERKKFNPWNKWKRSW